ncbi:hypothetical protein CWB71_19275 [Pseudoalteromonas sp. S983]|nr:hypothetical protein CWB71_19275 [Pseudoalteromonas sp. S983]
MEKHHSATQGNTLTHLKLLNKLGAAFFVMFIIGAYLPLADLGGWSTENFSLYKLAEPSLLIVLAVTGTLIYASGVSRLAGRAVSFLFVILIVGWFLSQLYDIYDMAKTYREVRGRPFEFKHFARSFEDVVGALNIQGEDIISPASFLLVISFIGIAGCIYSPRYRENKLLKATLLGQNVPASESPLSSANENGNSNKEKTVIAKGKNLLSIIVLKAIRFIKYIYKIVKPLIEALLDKAADIICEKQPNLEREKVKWVLLAIIIVLIFMIF